VNGFPSKALDLSAGILHGAAEACGEYLFIPWALDCLLRTCPAVGAQVSGPTIVRGDFYADDSHVILRSLEPADIQAFCEVMEVFGEATNQRLNLDKSKLLPMGDWMYPLPSHVCGLAVVPEASPLGITFHNNAQPLAFDWDEPIGRIKRKLDRISKLHLSPFGRSMAAGSCGTSQLLHFPDP
jgi:hypothetical protein